MNALPFRLYSWIAMCGIVSIVIYAGHPIAGLGLMICAPYTLTVLEEL